MSAIADKPSCLRAETGQTRQNVNQRMILGRPRICSRHSSGMARGGAGVFRGRFAAVEPELNSMLFKGLVKLLSGLHGFNHWRVHTGNFFHCLALPVSAFSRSPTVQIISHPAFRNDSKSFLRETMHGGQSKRRNEVTYLTKCGWYFLPQPCGRNRDRMKSWPKMLSTTATLYADGVIRSSNLGFLRNSATFPASGC